MAGTQAGGKQAAETNRNKHGSDFYRTIGAIGGAKKVPKGFAISGLASSAGRTGGLKSKRTKSE